jgi:uncharacterized protein YkwD
MQSPTTRDLRRRVSLRTMLALLFVVFATGLAVTWRYISNWPWEKLTSASQHESPRPQSVREETGTIPSPAPSIKLVAHVTSTPIPTSFVAGPDWLQELNRWRMMAKLSHVEEHANAVRGATAHARYMVKNYIARNPETPHHEEPGNPWFTKEGAEAAPNGEEYYSAGSIKPINFYIEGWMDGTFHRLGLLERNLTTAGYGHYCEGGNCASVVVLRSHEEADTDPTWFGKFPEPVMFPSNGTTVPARLSALTLGEWPEPLSLSCSGYRRPAGYPITLQFDSRFVPKLLSFSLSHNGAPIEGCGYDSTSYTNSEQATQDWARAVLKGYGAVVIIPRNPLERGATYVVTVTVEGQSDPFASGSQSPFAGLTRHFEWSFSVAP